MLYLHLYSDRMQVDLMHEHPLVPFGKEGKQKGGDNIMHKAKSNELSARGIQTSMDRHRHRHIRVLVLYSIVLHCVEL